MCGNSKKEEWIESRLGELLPIKYYHVVFTLPHQLNSLIMGNRKEMFDLLFNAASYTLLKFSGDEKYLGAQPGIINISFQYKDYADKAKKKLMILSGAEFLGRFEQHILPKRICKIRHYGYHDLPGL